MDAYQLPTGTIIAREPKPAARGAALYARVASAGQNDDVSRQMQRLRDYAAARGYQVVAEVTEIASGLNDERPKLKKVPTDARVGVIVADRWELSSKTCSGGSDGTFWRTDGTLLCGGRAGASKRARRARLECPPAPSKGDDPHVRPRRPPDLT